MRAHLLIRQDFEEACRRIKQLETELARNNSSTYCAYCGELVLKDDQSASKIKAHIMLCEKHPIRQVQEQAARQRAALERIAGLGRPLLETAMQLCEIAREALEMDGEVGR